MSTAPSSTSSTRTLAGIPSRTTDFPFPTQPTTTPTGGNGYNGGNGGVNSTLYLFTFLTTLLLLLAVSCGIVVRSYILRRRFHRRVEEAIAAGVLLPGQTADIGMGPGGTINVFRRHIGEKPKMWEVWIDEQSSDDKRGLITSEWSKIQPVAATQISDAPPKPKFGQTPGTPAPPAPTSILGRFTSRLPFSHVTRRGNTPSGAAPASPDVHLPALRYGMTSAPGQRPLDATQVPNNDKTALENAINPLVQVAVLIAMPDPSRPRYVPGSSPTDDANGDSGGVKGKQRSFELPPVSTEDHELPEICIGMTQANISRDASVAPAFEQLPGTPKS